MLDTVKLAIPLSKAHHRRIHSRASTREFWNWARVNQSTGDLLIRRNQGILVADGESYHREIRFAYPPDWSKDARLTVEFSVPKYWYGHNISLLYNWIRALDSLRNLLLEQFDLKRSRFPKLETWEVMRADACYCFRFPSQDIAQAYLDSIKRLRFPRKAPVIHPTSIFWGGGTYSLKLYLKLPEFQAHDLKALVKQNASLEWIEELEKMAEGVLRVEATLRTKYLRRMGIKTVADLSQDICRLEWDRNLDDVEGFEPRLSVLAICARFLGDRNQLGGLYGEQETENFLANGAYYHAPDCRIELDSLCYMHPSGGFTYRKLPTLLFKLRELLHRLLGGSQGMSCLDKLESVLLAHYKPNTAANLTSFWLYVRQFGAEKAKEVFGKTSFYYRRRQLKKAGVGLVEADENLIKVDPEFFRAFKLDIPSEFVGNRVDDLRDSRSLLNLLPINKASNN